MTLNTYFVKAIPKAAAKESSPAITQTKVYRKVSRAWEDKVDKLESLLSELETADEDDCESCKI